MSAWWDEVRAALWDVPVGGVRPWARLVLAIVAGVGLGLMAYGWGWRV